MAIVECRLCPRRCRIANGGRGDCRVRVNLDGTLYTLVYGKPCAANVDPIEKKPLYHVLPGTSSFSIATAGCNGHCKFCQNWQISQRPPEETRNYDMPPEKVVAITIQNKCDSISYTYTDPVIFYEYAIDTCRLAKKHALRNVLVTAGYIETEPLVELCAVADAANVDLKGITEKFYRDICSLGLKEVQRAIVTMKKHGVWVELTNLVIPTLNDSERDIRKLCRWVADNLGADTPVHFSRFWPMYQLQNLPPTPLETLSRAYDIARAEGIRFVYVGNVPGHHGNNTYCPHDGKVLIRRRGYIISENNIVDGKCGFCQRPVPGIWS